MVTFSFEFCEILFGKIFVAFSYAGMQNNNQYSNQAIKGKIKKILIKPSRSQSDLEWLMEEQLHGGSLPN